jgi:hypothetical protein
MKKVLIIISLCVLGLSFAVCFAVKELLTYAKVNSNLHWGPEPRVVKITSANEVSFNVFYGRDGAAAQSDISKISAHHYYRATAIDASSGATLNWKLSCDQLIQPPATMTYTPYGAEAEPRLEIRAVVSGPYRDEQEAAAAVGVNGILPADEETKKFVGVVEGRINDASVYVLQRTSIVAGNDFRYADPSTNPNTGQNEVMFTLTYEAGNRFHDYTSKNVGRDMAVVMNDSIREVAVIKGAIRDRGVIEGTFRQEEVVALSKLLRTGANHRAENYGSLAGAGISNTQNHCTVSADDGFDFLGWITR